MAGLLDVFRVTIPMSKSLWVFIAILLVVTNSITGYLIGVHTSLGVSHEVSKEFERSAIKAKVGKYNEFLDFEFKPVQEIVLDYLHDNSIQIGPPPAKSAKPPVSNQYPL